MTYVERSVSVVVADGWRKTLNSYRIDTVGAG